MKEISPIFAVGFYITVVLISIVCSLGFPIFICWAIYMVMVHFGII